MQSVYMHVDGSGVIWALTKCRVCGEVHKYLASEVIEGHAQCKSCRHRMSMEGAVFTPLSCAEGQTRRGDGELPCTHQGQRA